MVRPRKVPELRRYASNVGVDLLGVPKNRQATLDAITRCEHPLTLGVRTAHARFCDRYQTNGRPTR